MKRRIFRKVFAHPFHVPGFLEILEFVFSSNRRQGNRFPGSDSISWISRSPKFRESKFVFRGDARSNTICEHFQFVIVSRASSPKHNSGSSKSRIFTRREISRIRISPDIFTQYFSHSTKSPKSNSKSRKFQYLSIRQEMSARNSTEKSQRNDNAKISRSKIIKSSVRNWRRTKERSFPSEIMTPRFLRGGTRWGRGGHEFVSRSIYPPLPTRRGYNAERPSSQIRRRILTRPAPRCPFCSRARGTESTARYRCLRSGGRHCPTTETTYASHASAEQQRDERRGGCARACLSRADRRENRIDSDVSN